MEQTVVSAHAARRSCTDRKIQDAVLAIIRTQGISAVTMEAVAARSGTAKTTLYRRFADRSELVVSVIDQLAPLVPEAPLEGEPVTKEAFAQFLRSTQEVYEDRIGLAAIAGLLASDEKAMQAWREKVFVPHVERIRRYLERGVRAGALNPALDYRLLVEMLVGGMLMRDGLAGDVPDDWADEVVDSFWPLIRAPEPDEPAEPEA